MLIASGKGLILRLTLRGISMEDERIKAVKQWLEPKSVRDIQVLL